ncbi:hypothetical protein [Amycolatopsis sulphurea]|uniref:hypothetical protein n=1 Tax=Amycolatopsis sulphurea TaxID=76022 RepID=UPI001473A60F|nr:hypothetical protein [Amycolatopsis sulphurea]
MPIVVQRRERGRIQRRLRVADVPGVQGDLVPVHPADRVRLMLGMRRSLLCA